MNAKTILICILIFISRVVDLYTTLLAAQFSMKNFHNEEQNLIVKITSMSMKTFFIMEIILAGLVIGCYLLYLKNRNLFAIKAFNLKQYINMYFFNKTTTEIKDWLTYVNLKKTLVLFGSCVPIYIVTTSILFSLNNYWVSLYKENNQTAIKYYLSLNKYYFFDFIIFVFPIILIMLLLIHKLYNEFENNNISKMVY
ncbi:hypothetical protein SAMN06265349_102194 [Flavobacterium resistens]|uniref:Uncharacterized protein n=1 Tax=Flavobacterium resistens TaxID=443612 RepID=A0A521C4Q2_9FLAO|nr:hypothetical protein [Flavobacterium resistens]MRX69591.1 hypothetical protein [Flavobacterium resistens]SMO54467.1 hypothetical protein SAMN06265349_102194 [Flavobacterium resistens]